MDKEPIKESKEEPKNLDILFVGDSGRGKRIQDMVKASGWNLRIKTKMNPFLDECISCPPDIVILDNFPESETARTVYHRLRMNNTGKFVALNRSPNPLKFMYVNSLSFIKMVRFDPDPEELMEAVSELIRVKAKVSSR